MGLLRNLPLMVKSLLGFVTVVIFLVFIGYRSVHSIQNVATKADIIYSSDVLGLGTLTSMEMEFLSARIALREALITDDMEFRTRRLSEFEGNVRALKDSSAAYAQRLRTEEGKQLYAQYEKDLQAFEEIGTRIAGLLTSGDIESAKVLTLSECIERSDKVKADLQQLLGNKRSASAATRDESISISDDSISSQVVFTAVASVFCLFFGVVLAMVISRPVRKLTTAAEAIANGDLNHRIDSVESSDEVGRLAASFRMMVENLKTRMREAHQKGEEAERAAAEAKTLRQGAEAAREDLAQKVDVMLTTVAQFAKGDLTAMIKARSDDSIGELYNGYNRALENVRSMIKTISSQVHVVQDSSVELSQKGSTLAVGIKQQAMQITEISSAMEEMNATITENSRMASSAAQEAQEAKNEAQRGGDSLRRMIENVGQVSAVVRNSSTIVSQLGDSSQRIGEIVSVIEEIADQTNLLALNAAIEAARAGEQGRGFAVVADEVRKLAERTQGATKEIGSMIGEIQKNTANAVTAMHTGSELVNAGESHVETARKALEIIIQKSAYVADYITTLAAASEQQSSTSAEVTRSVETISAVVESSAVTTDEIAGIARTLQGLTDELNELMMQFKTDIQGTMLASYNTLSSVRSI